MNFTLPTFTSVLIRSINIRAEMNGKEPKPAVDIGMRLVGSNRLLDMFDLGLRPAFYRPATVDEGKQSELEGVDPATDTPELRTTSLEMPVALIREYLGRDVVIDYGLGGKHNISLSTCDVNAFKANMKEGGTVEIDFRVQVSDVNEKALGKLGGLVKHDVLVTIMSSPEADGTQEKLPGTEAPNPFKFSVVEGGGIKDNSPADPAPTAGDAFAAAVEAGQAPEAKPKKG